MNRGRSRLMALSFCTAIFAALMPPSTEGAAESIHADSEAQPQVTLLSHRQLREFFDDRKLADRFWSDRSAVSVERRSDGRALFLWNREIEVLFRLDSSYRLSDIAVPAKGVVPVFGGADVPIGWSVFSPRTLVLGEKLRHHCAENVSYVHVAANSRAFVEFHRRKEYRKREDGSWGHIIYFAVDADGTRAHERFQLKGKPLGLFPSGDGMLLFLEQPGGAMSAIPVAPNGLPADESEWRNVPRPKIHPETVLGLSDCDVERSLALYNEYPVASFAPPRFWVVNFQTGTIEGGEALSRQAGPWFGLFLEREFAEGLQRGRTRTEAGN